MTRTNKGILFMVASTVILALQDGVTRHLTTHYPVQMVVMCRFWFIGPY